jgi:Flp pilus assembly protein TadD
MQPQMTLGAVLTAMHRDAEARPVYRKALAIARTMEPSAQESWIPSIQQRLGPG